MSLSQKVLVVGCVSGFVSGWEACVGHTVVAFIFLVPACLTLVGLFMRDGEKDQ